MITKEDYIPDINEFAKSVQEILLNDGLPKNYLFKPKSTALLVLDVQNYFAHPQGNAYFPSSNKVVPKLKELITFFKTNHCPIVFTRHSNDSSNANMMARRFRRNLEYGSFDHQIILDLNTDGSIIIEKHQYDAFYETNLDAYLQSLKVDTLVICGLIANLCVESTARAAFVRGYQTIVPIDATATYNLELHISAVRGVSFALGNSLTTNEVIRFLSGDGYEL